MYYSKTSSFYDQWETPLLINLIDNNIISVNSLFFDVSFWHKIH